MKSLASTTAIFALVAGMAVAQESGTTTTDTSGTDLSMGTGMGADLSSLPEACRSGAGGGSLSGTTTGASDSAGSATTGTESGTASDTATTGTGDTASGDSTTSGTGESGTADASADSTDPAASTDGTGTETATAETSTESTGAAGMGAGSGMSSAMTTMHGQMMAVQGITDQDLAFACAMIPHHQGAIDMARAMEAQLTDEELKSLASTMITSHQAEIDTLTTWVESHGASGQ